MVAEAYDLSTWELGKRIGGLRPLSATQRLKSTWAVTETTCQMPALSRKRKRRL